jgi:hypothetical protein
MTGADPRIGFCEPGHLGPSRHDRLWIANGSGQALRMRASKTQGFATAAKSTTGALVHMDTLNCRTTVARLSYDCRMTVARVSRECRESAARRYSKSPFARLGASLGQ